MLSIFARANVRIYSPAKHVLSNVEGTLSSQRPHYPTIFLRGPYLDFSELGALCVFARDNLRDLFSRKYEKCYLFTRTTQRKPRWHVEVSMGWAMRAAGR